MSIDVPGTAQHIRYFAGWCDKIEGGWRGEEEAGSKARYAVACGLLCSVGCVCQSLSITFVYIQSL